MSGVRAAIEALGAAGVPQRAIAAELGVHRTTVGRWSRGATPKPANVFALRTLVDELLASALSGDAIADGVQGAHLQRAKHYLESPEQAVKMALLAASIARTLKAAQRELVRSVTRGADPFAICRADLLDDKLDAFLPLSAAA